MDVRIKLAGPAALNVYERDRGTEETKPQGIIARLTAPPDATRGGGRVDGSIAKAIARAMEQAGIRPSNRSRRVGDYELGSLLFQGPAYQDYEAAHVALKGVKRRVRLYPIPLGASPSDRETIRRAAQREFQILEGIHHPGLLRALKYKASAASPDRAKARPEPCDLFLSHASEDKDPIARPLYGALTAAGVSVWFDEAVLELGDSLRRKIDEGLSRSQYGVVILSPSFFSKQWPQKELDGLVARETASGENAIIPIWHEVDLKAVPAYSPTLADRVAGRSTEGVAALVEKILRVLKKK